MKYRAEIDGLRALAVVPVILFHAGFEVFSGGFVGVDVFFVISGYLITTILIEDIAQGRFSLANFYERRARRILPALFLVMLVTVIFAWCWMLPSQMKEFSRAIVAVVLFSSNILFWRESGYFDDTAKENPLLHTWSLAVEEQYYVFFPIFLVLAWRFGRNRLFWLIVVLAAFSLVLSEWGWRNKPMANFYLAPTRAWELFAGSIVAFIVQKHGVRKNDPLALLGLLAIVYSIFAYDESVPFPSVYALAPVMGVVLLLLFASQETIAARVLSTKAFVGIGLISYSAYLWHQPMFAFARIKIPDGPSPMLMLLLSGLSVLIAVASWRFVETPFRSRSRFSTRAIFLYSFLGLVGFGAAGTFGYFKNGFEERLTTVQRDILAWEKYPRKAPYREGECFLGPEKGPDDFARDCIEDARDILIWGDSHAAAISSGWRRLQPISQLTASACPPVLNTSVSMRPDCRDINARVFEDISAHPFRTVVLHANWLSYGDETIERLDETLAALKKTGVETIVIVGGVPQYKPSLPQRLLGLDKPLVDIEDMVSSQGEVGKTDRLLRSIASNRDVTFHSALSDFCGDQKCHVVLNDEGKAVPVAWDYGHLTEAGAVYLAEIIRKSLGGS